MPFVLFTLHLCPCIVRPMNDKQQDSFVLFVIHKHYFEINQAAIVNYLSENEEITICNFKKL